MTDVGIVGTAFMAVLLWYDGIGRALLIKAFLPEVPIVVEEKCCAGVTPESHENALKAMQSCQIKVI